MICPCGKGLGINEQQGECRRAEGSHPVEPYNHKVHIIDHLGLAFSLRSALVRCSLSKGEENREP